MTEIKMKVFSFKRTDVQKNELPELAGARSFLATVNVKDIPYEMIKPWKEINPRNTSLKSVAVNDMEEVLISEPSKFFYLNRGLTLLVSKVDYDTKTEELLLTLTDTQQHGLIDGGHTFDVLSIHCNDEVKNGADVFVKIEIIDGIDLATDKGSALIVDLVRARNTSTQVKDTSINNLKGIFKVIKDVIKGESYENDVAYYENEVDASGELKKIPVRNLIACLICFDIDVYSDSKNNPIKAYAGKGTSENYFKDNHDRLEKFIHLLPTILKLRDMIYEKMPSVHNSDGGKFGNITGVRKLRDSKPLPYTQVNVQYSIPEAFIFPILASFRQFLKSENGKVSWKKDPIEIFVKHGDVLINEITRTALEDIKNPNALGKTPLVWKSCYDTLAIAVKDAE